jgi:hypothetical protein
MSSWLRRQDLANRSIGVADDTWYVQMSTVCMLLDNLLVWLKQLGDGGSRRGTRRVKDEVSA